MAETATPSTRWADTQLYADKLPDLFSSGSYSDDQQDQGTVRRALSFKQIATSLPEKTIENRLDDSDKQNVQGMSQTTDLATERNRKSLSQKCSSYLGEVFAHREPEVTARNRVIRDSAIMAEIRLNCKLHEEQAFLSDISFHLSEIYQRPESCIIVSVTTPQAMLFGGNMGPAYTMTITALASQIAANPNGKHIVSLQESMLEALGISPRRGIIRFDPVAEDNLAINGMTTNQEIEALERNSGNYSRALLTLSRNHSRKNGKSGNTQSKSRNGLFTPQLSRKSSKRGSSEDNRSRSVQGGENETTLHRRKSMMAIFGR